MAGVRRAGHNVAHSQADAMRAALVSGATEKAARALIESLHAASDARTKAFSATAGWIQALRTLEATAKTVSSRFACVLNSGTVATIADVQAVKMYHFNDSLCQGLNALVTEAEAATRAANTALNDYSTLLLKCLEHLRAISTKRVVAEHEATEKAKSGGDRSWVWRAAQVGTAVVALACPPISAAAGAAACTAAITTSVAASLSTVATVGYAVSGSRQRKVAKLRAKELAAVAPVLHHAQDEVTRTLELSTTLEHCINGMQSAVSRAFATNTVPEDTARAITPALLLTLELGGARQALSDIDNCVGRLANGHSQATKLLESWQRVPDMYEL